MARQAVWWIAMMSLVLTGTIGKAQVSTGTISGTVKDATGAVIPGVEVVIRNVETGSNRALTSNEQGRYAAPQLAAGS